MSLRHESNGTRLGFIYVKGVSFLLKTSKSLQFNFSQVTGELSNNGEAMRRFMQTFVLAPQSHKKYYVHNDIFR